jgi:hypothetical protein
MAKVEIRSYGPMDSGGFFGRMQPLTSGREATMPASGSAQLDFARVGAEPEC